MRCVSHGVPVVGVQLAKESSGGKLFLCFLPSFQLTVRSMGIVRPAFRSAARLNTN